MKKITAKDIDNSSNLKSTYTKEDIQDDYSKDIERRIDLLRSIKAKEIRNAKISRKKLWLAKDDCNKYESHLSFMCVTTFVSTFMSAMPPMHWMWLNQDSSKNVDIINEAWMAFLVKTDFPKEFLYTTYDAWWTWAWYLYLGFVDDTRKVEYSKYKKWKKTTETKEKTTYYWPKVNYIPFENLYYNWRDIGSSTEAALVNSITMKEFETYYVSDDNYKITKEKLQGIKNSNMQRGGHNKQDIIWLEDDFVEIVEFYCTSDNSRTIMANWISIDKDVNPYPHCEIPFHEIVINPTPDNASGISLPMLIQDEEHIYNQCMRYLLKIADLSVGIASKENADDLIVDKHEILWNIVNADPEDFQFKTPQYNPQIFQVLADTMLQNAILKTIDFTNQVSRSQYESSRSVAYRQNSLNNRINTFVSHWLQTMFTRMSRQWLCLMQDMWNYDKHKLIISTKNKNIDKDDKEVENWGDSFFDVWYEDIKWKYEVFLDTDRLIWPNKDEKVEEIYQLLSWVSNLADPKTGQPIIPREQIADALIETLRYKTWVNLSKDDWESISTEEEVQSLFWDWNLLWQLGEIDPQLAAQAANVSPAAWWLPLQWSISS